MDELDLRHDHRGVHNQEERVGRRQGSSVIDDTLRPHHQLLLLLLLFPPPLLVLLLLPLAESALEEELGGGGVHLVAASQRRHHQERSPGSHVTDRGCRTLRLRHLRRRRRPRPQRQGLQSPWGVVRLAPCLLSGPGGCGLAPWSAVLGVHIVRVVHHHCQGHADGLLLVPEHRTQPPLTPSLSSAHGLPAGLIHSR